LGKFCDFFTDLPKRKAAPIAEGGEFSHFALRGDCLNMTVFREARHDQSLLCG
jgi:hypothetical protein